MADLIPPLGGLSDELTFDAQPFGTSTSMLNSSSIDPVTGRIGFGPRAGSEQYNTNRLAVMGKVQALAQSVSDNRRTTFTAKATVAAGDLTEWADATPSKESTVASEPDEFGNVFVIDGAAALVKINSAGNEVWRFSLPIKDDGQICRAIALDPFGNVYVGVSEGGAQTQARLWAFSPDDDLRLKLRWTRSPGAFVARLRWQDGYLYAAENDVEGNRAYYALYSGAATGVPELAQRKDVTAPVNDFVVNSAGAVITTHPPSATRRLDPRYPDYSYIIDEQRWNPTLLANFDRRKWCRFSAANIKSQPEYKNIKDGDTVRIWRDSWGSGRKLMEDTSMSSAATPKKFVSPTYVEKGPGGKPALRFSGNRCRLISEKNPSEQESMADLQRTMIPGYRNSGYAMFIMCKPSESSHKERLLGQDNTAGGTREILVNQTQAAAADNGAIVTNQAGTVGSDPSTGATHRGYFTNKTSTALVTVISGNGHSALYGISGEADRDSVWRVNGCPLGFFKAADFYTSAAGTPTTIGCRNDETEGFTGDIQEILVFRDYTPDGGVRTLFEFPLYDDPQAHGAFNAASDTECERVEGWLAWDNGTPHMLDDGAGATVTPTWNSGGVSSSYKHAFSSDINAPYRTQQGPPNPAGRDGDPVASGSFDIDMFNVDPLSVKWSPQRGNVNWTNVGPGQGHGIAIDSDDNIFTVGPQNAALVDKTLVKWTDRGASVVEEWSYGNGHDYDYEHARLAVDSYKNLFVPFGWSGAAAKFSLKVFDTHGAVLLNYKVASTLAGQSVSIDPSVPDYGSQAITLPEFVYLTTSNAGIAARPTVHKIRLVNRAVTSGSARDTALIGVCNGQVVRMASGTGAPTPISGPQLSATGLVCPIWAFQKVHFIDGTSYLYYDPVTDVTAQWASTSAGAMPAGARWGALWNGRMWLIRCPGDPHNWHASAQGDVFNWDTNPATPLVTQAVSGNDAEMGMFADIPNTLIVASRERMYVGCDHTIQLVYGDPLIGGSITEVSNETGASFGPCWTLDDVGTPYFFGSRGGVYRINGNRVESISTAIERRLMDVDLSLYYVQLSWNSELGELWVMEVPYGQGGTARRLWRWQKNVGKRGAWHQDTFANTLIQPTCFVTYDADLVDDRAFLFGCEDGRVRNFNRDAKDDDGYPIAYHAAFGPLGVKGGKCRIGGVQITLASDQGGCTMEMFASDTADVMGEGVHRVDLVPGLNSKVFRNIAGRRVWIRLSSALAGNRSRFEEGTYEKVFLGRATVTS